MEKHVSILERGEVPAVLGQRPVTRGSVVWRIRFYLNNYCSSSNNNNDNSASGNSKQQAAAAHVELI
jgi:hypothetical protein